MTCKVLVGTGRARQLRNGTAALGPDELRFHTGRTGKQGKDFFLHIAYEDIQELELDAPDRPLPPPITRVKKSPNNRHHKARFPSLPGVILDSGRSARAAGVLSNSFAEPDGHRTRERNSVLSVTGAPPVWPVPGAPEAERWRDDVVPTKLPLNKSPDPHSRGSGLCVKETATD